MLYRFLVLLAIISGIAVLALFLSPGIHGTLLILHGPLTIFRGKACFLRLLLLIWIAGNAFQILRSQWFTFSLQKSAGAHGFELPVYTLVCCFRC